MPATGVWARLLVGTVSLSGVRVLVPGGALSAGCWGDPPPERPRQALGQTGCRPAVAVPSLRTALLQLTAASHFLLEENRRQAQLHLYGKPHGPALPPSPILPKVHPGASRLSAVVRITVCFLSFRIAAHNSMS